MAPKGVRDPEAVLAIDIGSTATRAGFAWRDGNDIETQVVENRLEAAALSAHSTSQFSSKIFPFDDNSKRYLGHADHTGREATSAKFAPYVILGTTEEMQEQYPLLSRLQNERNKEGFSEEVFNKRLEEGLKQLLRSVLAEAKKAMNVRRLDALNIQVKTVAMTVPSQWDLDFQDLYERLLKQVFGEVFDGVPQAAAHDIEVIFHTEGTALAQYIFNCSTGPKALALGGGMPEMNTITGRPNAQYFLDCGGHNGNGILSTYHRSQDGPVLYEIGQPQGAGGGNELWVQNLLDQLAVLHRHKNDEELPFELHQTFRDAINGFRNNIMGGKTECVAGLHPQTGQMISFPITKEMSDKAYETAFQHLKIMITGQLKRLASIKNGWGGREHSVTIIMSGGSCLHPNFANWMRALCEKLSLPEPLSTHSMEIQYWSSRIAKGGAYATLTQMSVASFAEKCAFGLQKGYVRNQGEDSEHVEYEDSADIIWYKESGGTIPFESAADGDRAEYRIVCEPFLDSYRAKLHTDERMAEEAAYDFLNLGTLPDGYFHRVELKFDCRKEQIELNIVLMPLPYSAVTDGMKRKAAVKEKVLSFGPFGVHVQPGTLSLLIKKPVEEVDQHVDGILRPFRPFAMAKRRATRADTSRGKIPGSTRQPKTTAPRAATSSNTVPETASDTNNNPAVIASSSVNEASSSVGNAIAPKAMRTSAASPASRPSKGSSGGTAFDRRAPSEVPPRTLPNKTTNQRLNNNVLSSGEASSSIQRASSPKAPTAQDSTSVKRKRPDTAEADGSLYIKRPFQRSGFFKDVVPPPKKDASQEPDGDRRAASKAAQRSVASSPEGGRYKGSAFWGRDLPAAAESSHAPQSRRNATNEQPPRQMNDSAKLKAPSRQAVEAQEYPFSDRHRENGSMVPAGYKARRNPHNNVSLTLNPAIGRAPSSLPRHGTAAPRPAPGNAISGSLPVGSPRPGSGSRSARSSGPAGSSQQPPGFNGWAPANRPRGPPRSD